MWEFKQHFREIFYRPNDRYAFIDGLRAMSIIWVIIFHSIFGITKILDKEELTDFMQRFPAFLNVMWQGDKAVDVFLIVSGFLIGLFLFREMKFDGGINLNHFYQRRVLRIVPVYLFILGFYFLAGYETDLPQLITNLLFISTLFPSHYEVVHVSWSLMIEMQFYLVAPFFVLLFMRFRFPIIPMVILFLLSFYIRYQILYLRPEAYGPEFYQIIFDEIEGRPLWVAVYENLYTRFAPIVLGLLIAYYYVFDRESISAWFEKNNWMRYLLLVTGLAIVVITTSAGLHNPLSPYYDNFEPGKNLYYFAFNRYLFSFGFAILVFDMTFVPLKKNLLARILAMRIWYPISQMVFPIYLIHSFIVVLAGVIVFGTTEFTQVGLITTFHVFAIALVALLITAVIAIPVHVFIEKPFMAARK